MKICEDPPAQYTFTQLNILDQRSGFNRDNQLIQHNYLNKVINIHENIKRFFENKKDIVAVYLFGSYADGKERISSDVDLAILFDNRDREAVNQRLDEYLVALSRIIRKDAHMVAMDFAGEGLLKQIFKKGKCLVVNDSKKMAYFKMIAYSKIANFHYYRSQMQEAIVRKVMEGI